MTCQYTFDGTYECKCGRCKPVELPGETAPTMRSPVEGTDQLHCRFIPNQDAGGIPVYYQSPRDIITWGDIPVTTA